MDEGKGMSRQKTVVAAEMPMLCAWCLDSDGLAATQGQSHSICKQHAEEQYRRYKSRKLKQGAD